MYNLVLQNQHFHVLTFLFEGTGPGLESWFYCILFTKLILTYRYVVGAGVIFLYHLRWELNGKNSDLCPDPFLFEIVQTQQTDVDDYGHELATLLYITYITM
jgi:hypothetical protein